MSKVVVAGVSSLFLTVPVDRFPVPYAPARHPDWIQAEVAGTGAHVASVLRALGDRVRLCTVVGPDPAGSAVRAELAERGLDGVHVVEGPATAVGVHLLTPDGQRASMRYALGVDAATYPPERFVQAARDADLAVVTNTMFARPLLPYAVALGVPIAVDVHVIGDVDESYDQPWLQVADILFCSHENLPCTPGEWIGHIMDHYPGCAIAAVGCGAKGCVMGLRDGRLITVDAVAPRGVVNTNGAGDALFASFVHTWLATGNPVEALQTAVVYAGWQVGSMSPSRTLPNGEQARVLRARYPVTVRIGRWRTEGGAEPPRSSVA